MSANEINDTQPNPVSASEAADPVTPDTQPQKPVQAGGKFPRWLLVAAIAVLVVLGALSGYGAGMGQRKDAQSTQVAGQIQEQFDLGVQKMEAGQYELAKSHFEFVISKDPNYPGLLEAYTELLLRMDVTPTPTVTNTPAFTPTPDLRGVEAIYASVKTAFASRDWDTALDNLDSLRKADPNYRSAEVDGLYYLALRMRGIEKIILQEGETCPDINLEGGIYDLTLASRFGTLDAPAESLRAYARLYIIGASYWDQDWDKAQYYFELVMAGNPNLRDASCMSAIERWRYATVERAKKLLAGGDACAAEEQFNLAFTISSLKNEAFYPTATKVYEDCHGGGGGGEPPPSTGGTPTLTPTETPTPIETPTP